MMKMILYEFNRNCVQTQDFSRFLRAWEATGFSQGSALRSCLNAFVFFVGGYDEDPRELFIVPEVRAFYRAFNAKWPFWFFACDLRVPNLLTMTFCCLDSIKVTQRSPEHPFRVDFKPSEMRRFLQQEVEKLEVQCRQAGMSVEQIHQRRRQVLEYFERDWRSFDPLASQL